MVIINLPGENMLSKTKTSVTPCRVSPCKTLHSDKIRQVRIIWDSHLKGLAIIIKQQPNSQFDVSSIIKPGAKTNQLLDNQHGKLKSLGEKKAF
jgi:hypothetical protein